MVALGNEPSSGVRAARALAGLARAIDIALADIALSLPQYRLLVGLSQGISVPSAVAKNLSVKAPSITALVDSAVRRGFVARRIDEDDRRRISLALTDEGRRVLEQADRSIGDLLTGVVSELACNQAEAAMRGLELWSVAIDMSRRQTDPATHNAR